MEDDESDDDDDDDDVVSQNDESADWEIDEVRLYNVVVDVDVV